MGTFLKVLQFFLELFGRKKVTPQELEDNAKDEIKDNTLDDNIDTISNGMRDQ